MLEPWNSKSIMQPLVHTTPSIKQIDVKDLKHACNNIMRVLLKQSPLHREGAILSRFLYKYDKKFRHDIGYKNIKKVNTALRKYLTLDLIKDVTNFINVLPAADETNPYFPTRQMLEYVLVRLMTFSKLMLRINVCAKLAGVFYLNRIKNGESHWMSLMPYSLLSRIWSLSLVLLQHTCNWYSRLHAFLHLLQHKGLNFLPEDYKLPQSLKHWIDLKNLNDEGRFNWSQKTSVNIDSIIIDNEEGDLCENILEYVDNINTTKDSDDVEMKLLMPKTELEPVLEIPHKNDDQGVSISRDSFKVLSNNIAISSPVLTKQNNAEVTSHSIINVSNKDSLNMFVNNEERYRNSSNIFSVTSHLSFMQWQTLKTTLLKLKNIKNETKIKKKANKIWKEKSLVYK